MLVAITPCMDTHATSLSPYRAKDSHPDAQCGCDLFFCLRLTTTTTHPETQAPNNQGTFAFGTGPYAPNTSGVGGETVDGNFNYYTLDASLFNYDVDAAAAANIVARLNGKRPPNVRSRSNIKAQASPGRGLLSQ